MILTDVTPRELEAYLEPHGFSQNEARRIYAHHVQHGRRNWNVRDLAKSKCARAAELLETPTLEVVSRVTAADGFTKYLFRLPSGHPPRHSLVGGASPHSVRLADDGPLVEAVRIPLFDEKYTLCISSQAGCPLACAFCATGKMGLIRSLATWEIVEQLRIVREDAARETGRPVRGVVFMGMGEPFLNYDNVIKAAQIFADPSGGAISGRAITISTAGIVPAIRRYTAEKHPYRLAISLTSGTPEQRRWLMPIEKKHPLEELVAAIREHAEATRDRVMIEYVAIAGVNCRQEDALALKTLLDGIPVRFNLIEVNDASGEFLPPSEAELKRFRDALQILGAPIVRRYSGGKDIRAACGMLAAEAM